MARRHSRFENDANEAGYGVLWIIIGLLVAGALIFGAIYYFGTLQKNTADFRGGVGEREQTVADPNYRIQQYNNFFNLCNQVVASEQQIALTKEEPDFNTAGSISRQNYQAQRAERIRLINDYNARAQQTRTAGQYLDPRLPESLNVLQEPTTCAR